MLGRNSFGAMIITPDSQCLARLPCPEVVFAAFTGENHTGLAPLGEVGLRAPPREDVSVYDEYSHQRPSATATSPPLSCPKLRRRCCRDRRIAVGRDARREVT